MFTCSFRREVEVENSFLSVLFNLHMLETRFVLIEFWSLNVDVFLNVLEKYAISPFRV